MSQLRPSVRRAAIASGLASVLLATAAAGPASAAVEVMKDPVKDGSSDIVRVRVNHAEGSLKLKIKVRDEDEFAHFYDVWVDTDASDPGPEFVVTSTFEVLPKVSVSTATDFGDLTGTTRCTVRTAKARFSTATYSFSVPRRCLAKRGVTPDRVRVGVEASDEVGRHDWVPGKQTFSGWVRSG